MHTGIGLQQNRPLRARKAAEWYGRAVEAYDVLEEGVEQTFTLLERPQHVRGRPSLMAAAYGANIHVSDRTIDSHIRRIRKKLGDVGADDPIETVHGLGYRMRA